MQNGYFQVVRTPGGYGLQIFQPKDGGEDVRLQEVMDYLDRQSIPYDSMSIKKATPSPSSLAIATVDLPCLCISRIFSLLF